jgi:hypothetical protein
MTEARANEIFRTKYPTGEIVRKNASSAGYRYYVVFKEGGRVYYYDRPSYAQLLNSLGFKVAYKHDITTAQNALKRAQDELARGYEKSFHLFLSDEGRVQWEQATRAQIAECEDYLHRLQTEFIIENG